jgi:hypothetical protein
MEANESRARAVVTSVRGEQDHGFLSLGRRVFGRESAILSAAMASFEGTMITGGTTARFLSIVPFRGSEVFQFVLLGRRLLAVDGLFSMLFRLSSSRCVFLCCVSKGRIGVWESLRIVVVDPFPTPSKSSTFDGDSSPSSSAADPEDRLRI